MRRVKPVPRPGPCGGWSHSESGGLSFCYLFLGFVFYFFTSTILYFIFSYFPSHLFLTAVSSFFFYFLPLPTNDLMLHCGLPVSSFLRFSPSFSFLLSLSLSDPGQPHRDAAFPLSIALAVSKPIFVTSALFLILVS